ncbi:MAG: hypothetical protein HC837_12010 [Chloroflexaceae bacterium]|nr:hypothetical protein [Chloroflexaceae bacterium]
MAIHDGWKFRDQMIIPSLIIGAGGTGDKVVRALKRRIRLDWEKAQYADTPDLVQFLVVDSVAYTNRPEQEFLRPDEYSFLGGFDPDHVTKKNEAVKKWWNTFPPGILPPGIIHLGARQIRALGRVALFHAYPETWSLIQEKVENLNTISAQFQAIRAGFSVPVEKSARQVFIVASVCGGTGAGIFLDLAARLRSHKNTEVQIYGIFVLPSVFELTMPSDRQKVRIKANAYAALKELNAFWYKPGGFSVQYPGEKSPIQLTHAIFDGVFLIGREGRGKALSSLNDVTHQIAHFLYLASMNNMAVPLGEMSVNLDKTEQFYTSFAVGALNLPQTKISDSLLADLKRRYLLNLVEDKRHKEQRKGLEETIDAFMDNIEQIAQSQTTNLIGTEISPDEYNRVAQQHKSLIVRRTFEWVVRDLLKNYGINAIAIATDICKEQYTRYTDDIAVCKTEIDQARRGNIRVTVLERLGPFGQLVDTLLPGRSAQSYEEEEKKSTDDLVRFRLLAPESDDHLGSERLFTYVVRTLDQLAKQIGSFPKQARVLASRLEQESKHARQREATTESERGDGREALYYDMDIDPSLPGDAQTLAALFRRLFSFDILQDYVRPERTLHPTEDQDRQILKPSEAIQLLGLVPETGSTRLLGRLATVTDVSDLITADTYNIKTVTFEHWEREALLDELLEVIVDQQIRTKASLISFFLTPEQQARDHQKEMIKGLKVMINHLMSNLKSAFWGAQPFPDEGKLERFMILCLPTHPVRHPSILELFKEYIDSKRGQFTVGSNPFRLDVLRLEHAAELKHIAEIMTCKQAYDTFSQQEQLHINGQYTRVPDVVNP